MNDRFIIDCYGIIDTWNSTGKCSDKLTWAELCDTLNELNNIADDKLDNYEYVTRLEKENNMLKNKLFSITGITTRVKQELEDIDLIIQYNKKEKINDE